MKKIFIITQIVVLLITGLFSFASTSSVQYSSGTVLEEFDSIGGWKVSDNCNIGIDTDIRTSGTGSIKITSTVSGGGGECNVAQDATAPKDLSNLRNVEFNLYTNDVSSFKSIAVFIMTDNGNFYYNYIGPWEMMNGWNKIRRSINDFSKFGNPSLNNIQKLWIKVEGESGKNPIINVDKISYNVEGKTNILFTFDDGSSGVYNYAYPILNAKGLIGTTWACKDLATSEDPAFMTPTQLTALYNAGWDISNHTVNHVDDVTTLTRAQKISEYQDNITWLNSLGFTRSSPHACYPMGIYDNELLSILPTIGVKSGRTTVHGIQPEPVEDIYRLKTVAVGRDTKVSYVKGVIDQAIATGSNVIFMFHDVAPSPCLTGPDSTIVISTSNLTEIVNYVSIIQQSGIINVPTISQWYNSYTNTTPIIPPLVTATPTISPAATPTSNHTWRPRPTPEEEDDDDDCTHDGDHDWRPSPRVTHTATATPTPTATPIVVNVPTINYNYVQQNIPIVVPNYTYVQTNIPVVVPNYTYVPTNIPVYVPNYIPTYATSTPPPQVSPTRYPGGMVLDMSVSLSTDKMKYTDGQTITYTIDYANKYNVQTGVIIVKAEIPQYTTLMDSAGGVVTGNAIEWTYNSLNPLQTGRIIYTVRVNTLDKPEVYANNTATIFAPQDVLQNINDDTSSIKVLLYSQNQNIGNHTLYIIGYPDKLFKPEQSITRAEVATIFARISGYYNPEPTSGFFNDVPSSHWASGFIAKSKDLQLFNGYHDGTFHPNEPITRAELAIVTTKYLKTGNAAPFVLHFADSDNHWAKDFIEQAYRYKLVTGYDDNTFRPNEFIKRSELVTMVNKMLFRGPLSVSSPKFPDVQPSHWAYGQVEESCIDHDFYRDNNGNEIMK